MFDIMTEDLREKELQNSYISIRIRTLYNKSMKCRFRLNNSYQLSAHYMWVRYRIWHKLSINTFITMFTVVWIARRKRFDWPTLPPIMYTSGQQLIAIIICQTNCFDLCSKRICRSLDPNVTQIELLNPRYEPVNTFSTEYCSKKMWVLFWIVIRVNPKSGL